MTFVFGTFVVGLITSLLLFASARSKPAHPPEITKSPNGVYQITSTVKDDGNEGELREVILKRGETILWKYAERQSKLFYFSWSPSSRFLLFGQLKINRYMTLWAFSFDPSYPNDVLTTWIDLDSISDHLDKFLPDLHDTNNGGCGIDWDSIRWSGDKATMTFETGGFGKYGSADFSLDFAQWPPTVKILKMRAIPRP